MRALVAAVLLSLPAAALAQEATPAATPTPEASPLPPSEPAPQLKKPWVAATYSTVFPGAGCWYLGEHRRGWAYAGVETAELAALLAVFANSGYDPDDATTYDRVNRVLLPYLWLQNTHFTGIYDAWRTARLRAPARYGIIPTPGVSGLLRAPFRGRILLRPEVGLPLAILAGAGVGYSFLPQNEATFHELQRLPLFSQEVDRWTALAAGESYYIATFASVGIGEEALFRGVIQTTLEEWFGPTWGWVAASALFGAVHALNGGDWQTMVLAAGVTGTVGGYLGWLYQRDGHDLTAGVFFHTWYDVIIGTTYFLVDPEHQPFSAGITIPF